MMLRYLFGIVKMISRKLAGGCGPCKISTTGSSGKIVKTLFLDFKDRISSRD